MKRGKRYQEAAKLRDKTNLYDAPEAVAIVKKAASAKFDETIEAHFKMGLDGRHADQQIRGAVVLPNGTGKKVRVLVFAKGDKAEEAVAAGAEFVGAEELIPKIQNEGWFDFDKVVATPNMMSVVGRLGRVLGPKGLMPNPKAGTVTMDVAKAVQDLKAGKIEYRLDKTNIIHVPIGKASFTAGSSPTVAPVIINNNRISANQRLPLLATGSVSLPLANITNTEDSPQVCTKESSAITTNVSPSRKYSFSKSCV